MTLVEFIEQTGVDFPIERVIDGKGYLVEVLDGSPPNSTKHDNYIKWMPEGHDIGSSSPSKEMTFSDALTLLKKGNAVRHTSWPEEVYIFKINGSNKVASAMGFGFGECMGEPTFRDTIFKKTEDNHLITWAVPQDEMLSNNWEVL